MTDKSLSTVNELIHEKGVVILDGGLSNQLATYHYDFERSELWTSRVLLDRPDLIKNVHRDYLRSGSDIITTVTYQATFQKLREKFGYSDERIRQIFELAIRMAEEAIDEFIIAERTRKIRPLIAISIGSYGAYTGDGNEYKGIYDLDENGLVEFHRERLDFIASKLTNQKNLIAFETIPNLLEARALVRLVRQYNVNAWLSFSVRNQTQCISDGTPIVELVELVRDVKQIFAIGINCVQPEDVEPILKKIKEANTNKLILIYPNNGDKYNANAHAFISSTTAFDWIEKVPEWKENYNLSLIGGCCRIGPKEISRIRSFFA